MKRFFNLDNPVWQFVGNIADMLLLSIFWYLCCLPVFTIGCGTTAVYYVTLKLVTHREGYTAASFWKSFKENFRQGTVIWLLCLAAGAVLAIDLYWALAGGSSVGAALMPAFCILLLLYAMFVTMLFPLLARCSNQTKTLLGMCFAMTVRSFLPVLSALIVTAAVFLTGIFLFWPLLLIAPGLAAYINSYTFDRILAKYHLEL